MLQASSTLRYHRRMGADGTAELGEVLIDGKPLDRTREYRVVVNNYLSEGGIVAEGGETLGGFKVGRDRAVLGSDIDALVQLLSTDPEALQHAAPGRIVRE